MHTEIAVKNHFIVIRKLCVCLAFVFFSWLSILGQTYRLTLPAVDGKGDLKLHQEEKVLVLHLWGSWCGYCQREHSLWNRLIKLDNVEYVSVVFRDKKENAIAFLDNYGDPFDRNVYLSPENAARLGAKMIPDTIVMHKGKIVSRHKGTLSQRQFDQMLMFQLSDLVTEIESQAQEKK